MFHSSANPIIRLVFAPILLLFYLQYSGAILPILAPIFVVIFLTIMPSRPPLNLMLKLLLVLFFVSFIIVSLGSILLDSPFGFALFCWAILFWSYYRSHQNPKDILSTLSLMVIIIMVVMSKQMQLPINGLPWLMFINFLLALVVTYLGFWLLPGNEKEILPDEKNSEGANKHIGLITFKATAISIVLIVLIATGSSQSLLIALTIASMIKSPISNDHKAFGFNKLITTSAGILFTLPIMLLIMFGVSNYVIFGVTIFCGIQLACYAIRRQCHLTIYQLLFTNFTVLTNQIITHPGIDSFSTQVTRLTSIVVAIFIGVLILNLCQHNSVVNNQKGQSVT